MGEIDVKSTCGVTRLDFKVENMKNFYIKI